MKPSQILSLSLIAAALLVLSVCPATSAVEVGVGQSGATDAKAAGAEAAARAKAALGDHEPKLVLVYHGEELFDDSTALLEGVTSVFDPAVVHGCSGYAALTHHDTQGVVAVLALAGDVEATAAVCESAGKEDDAACGERIGRALKPAAEGAKGGRVVILFGDCHVPRNDSVAKGVAAVLGEGIPVVGGAAFRGRVYAQGKAREKSNVGILLAGNFQCGCSLKQDNSPEGLVTSARQAFQQAVGDDQDKLIFTFTFDCGGRRNMMLDLGNFDKELQAMREVAGGTPFFGFFGSGEIGCRSTEETPCGVGHHISICALKGR